MHVDVCNNENVFSHLFFSVKESCIAISVAEINVFASFHKKMTAVWSLLH